MTAEDHDNWRRKMIQRDALLAATDILLRAQDETFKAHSFWHYIREAFFQYKCPFTITSHAFQHVIERLTTEAEVEP